MSEADRPYSYALIGDKKWPRPVWPVGTGASRISRFVNSSQDLAPHL